MLPEDLAATWRAAARESLVVEMLRGSAAWWPLGVLATMAMV